MENMFELLDEKLEVKDVRQAPAIEVKQGTIEFNDVHFRYHERYV